LLLQGNHAAHRARVATVVDQAVSASEACSEPSDEPLVGDGPLKVSVHPFDLQGSFIEWWSIVVSSARLTLARLSCVQEAHPRAPGLLQYLSGGQELITGPSGIVDTQHCSQSSAGVLKPE
jgi:hypothetical protein